MTADAVLHNVCAPYLQAGTYYRHDLDIITIRYTDIKAEFRKISAKRIKYIAKRLPISVPETDEITGCCAFLPGTLSLSSQRRKRRDGRCCTTASDIYLKEYELPLD